MITALDAVRGLEMVIPAARSQRVRGSTHLVVIASAIGVIGSFIYIPLLAAWAGLKAKTKKRLAVLGAVLLALVFWPVRASPGFRDHWIWDRWTEYFKTRVFMEPGFNPNDSRAKVFAFMPHGLYPMGAAVALVGDLNRRVFGGMQVAVANAARRVPIFRHLLGWIGDLPATNGAIRSTLARGKSVQLLPGGIGEMYYAGASHLATETLLLNDRKGFIKACMQAGAPIVPVYVFGTNSVFNIVPLADRLQWLGRLLQVSLVWFYGRGGLPIPFSVPLMYVVGAPIEVGAAVANPSPEQVERYHKVFVAAVVALFDKYKNVYGRGYGMKQLQIL